MCNSREKGLGYFYGSDIFIKIKEITLDIYTGNPDHKYRLPYRDKPDRFFCSYKTSITVSSVFEGRPEYGRVVPTKSYFKLWYRITHQHVPNGYLLNK